MHSRTSWLTWVVLGVGVVLRVALTIVTPPERAYDDHYEPVVHILEQHELPSAADCWECYQPPAYYVVSAGFCSISEPLAAALGVAPTEIERIGRHTLQTVSLVAGCVTLWFCLLIFRRVLPDARHEALALALVAFLPRHIYMSAMATNDAFTYLVASAAIWAALRAHASHWQTKWCIAAGALAGLAVLSKGYGWVTVVALLLGVWWHTWTRSAVGVARSKPTISRPLAMILCSALAVAVWPAARNVWIYGRPLVDNFDLHDSPMRFQPPGAVRKTEFFSLRLPALWAHPWVHTSQLRSFPTELYARTWFDYEGFKTTLGLYPPWVARWDAAAAAEPVWNEARWQQVLSPSAAEEPGDFRVVARIAYIAGIPLTIVVVTGLLLALRRARREFGCALLALHAVFAVAVPLAQTLRLPHFAAMKAAFMLAAISSGPIFVGLVLAAARRPWSRRMLVAVLGMACVGLALADALYVILQVRYAGAGG